MPSRVPTAEEHAATVKRVYDLEQSLTETKGRVTTLESLMAGLQRKIRVLSGGTATREVDADAV
jgi:hypothetical protein